MYTDPNETLYRHFRSLVEAMRLEQQRTIALEGEAYAHYSDIIAHFVFQIQEQRLDTHDVVAYRQAYRMEEQPAFFGPEALARECAALLVYHLAHICLPDPACGSMLGTCYVAGTSHVPQVQTLCDALRINDRVQLLREKHNPYDAHAVKVTTSESQKLGYLPARHNLFPAQMLDAGATLVGQIKKIAWKEQGVAIKVMLYVVAE